MYLIHYLIKHTFLEIVHLKTFSDLSLLGYSIFLLESSFYQIFKIKI